MKESSATDNNNNSLIVEDEERATSSGVETIIATEESSSFKATAVADDHAADDRAAAPKRKTTNKYKFYIIGGSLVVAAVLGVASFAGSNIRSSKQQVVAALMNNNDVVEEVDGYKFEGIGDCLDGSAEGGKRYDVIGFFDTTSPQACGKRCSGCPGGGQAGLVLRGFTYDDLCGNCYCHVDDGATKETLKGACAGYAGYFGAEADLLGTGEIKGTNGSTSAVCYKRLGRKSKSSKRGKANNEAGGM